MRIIVAGDSLGLPRPHRINNYSVNEYDLAVSYNETYPSIINKELLTYFKMNPFIEVINKSKRSQTIAGIYSEFIDILFFHQPDIIVLQIGIVDCWFREELNGGQHVPRKEYEEYLKKILSYLQYRPRCKLIIVGICPTSSKMQGRYPKINNEIKQYNKILKDKVDHKSVFYVNMEKHVNLKNIHQYLLQDDHHLNKKGNKLVATELLKIIKGIIYTNQGAEIEDKMNFKLMSEYFEKAFDMYPYNLDTVYNLLISLYEIKEYEKLIVVIRTIIDNNMIDIEIQNLIQIITSNLNNMD